MMTSSLSIPYCQSISIRINSQHRQKVAPSTPPTTSTRDMRLFWWWWGMLIIQMIDVAQSPPPLIIALQWGLLSVQLEILIPETIWQVKDLLHLHNQNKIRVLKCRVSSTVRVWGVGVANCGVELGKISQHFWKIWNKSVEDTRGLVPWLFNYRQGDSLTL